MVYDVSREEIIKRTSNNKLLAGLLLLHYIFKSKLSGVFVSSIIKL